MNPHAIHVMTLQGLLAVGLVGLNGFFVAAEFALVKIRETQLDALILKGNRRAKVARRIIANLPAYLGATQLGITVASLGLGWVAEPLFTALLSPLLISLGVESENVRRSVSFVIGFTALTFVHIAAGELAPKWTAIQRPVPLSLFVARPLAWFYILSFPFNWLLNRTAQWLLRQAGIESAEYAQPVHSHDELRLLISSSQEKSGASAFGREIVINALDLRRRIAREVMRPRQEIVPLDTQASIAACIEVAEKTRYSRFPLCEGGDLDRTLGVIHIKDLYAMRLKVREGRDLLPAARKLIYVPETARLEKLLQHFLERKLHLAIVVDEYGGTTGMVTLENILEEVVGQIQDEFDQEKPLLVRTSESTWDATGALPIRELEELAGEPLAQEGITTVSGWVTQRLGGFPRAGDRLAVGPFDLRVEQMDGPRIAKLKLARRADKQPGTN